MKHLLATIAIVLTGAAAHAAPVMKLGTGLGEVLVGENGMTLYTFTKDAAGRSNCYGGCATSWPPLFASTGDRADGAYTIIERRDGTKQWAKNGKPLYFWVNDRKPGDTTGDGVGGSWNVARP